MTAKKCPECGRVNPRYFTHCVDCDARLPDDTEKNGKISKYVKIGLALCAAIILIFIIVLPAVQYSHAYGQDLSKTVSEKQAEESQPEKEYALGDEADNGDLRISVLSARDGQNTFNSNKFFIVSVYMENLRAVGNIQVSNSDFTLIDSGGARYLPYGIGSQVTYDLSPAQSGSGELTFVIPQKVTGERIQFAFPGTTAFASNREAAVFIL